MFSMLHQFAYIFKFFRFLIRDKERPTKTKLFSAKLRAVLVTFCFSEYLIVNSAQCQPAQSSTPRSVGLRGVCAQCQPILDFQKIFENFRNIIIWILNSLKMEIFENKKMMCSAQCLPERSPTQPPTQCQPILDLRTFQFPIAQYQLPQSLTLRNRVFKQNH